MRRLPYYIALGALALSQRASAQGFGAVGSLLMAEGLTVRAIGLGRAYNALADDEASLQANPAGLARSQGLVLGGGHVLGLLDDQISYLSGAWRLSPRLGLGLQAAYAGSEDQARDAFGSVQGSFANRELLLGAGFGVQVAPGWRLGLAAKALHEDLAGDTRLGLAADAGLQADLPRGWSAGLSVQNVGAQSNDQALPTPLRLQGGIAAPLFLPHWHLEAGVQGLPIEGQARFMLGAELGFVLPPGGVPDRAALRGGLQWGLLRTEDPRLSLGAAVGLGPRLGLDYALAELGALGLTHRFSLRLRFDAPAPLRQGLAGADLSAPYGLLVTPQLDGLLVSWSHADEAVQGYNLYSDYGVLVERLNTEPLAKTSQRFIKVTRSRTYNLYVRPIGADGKEGPSSEIKTVRVR